MVNNINEVKTQLHACTYGVKLYAAECRIFQPKMYEVNAKYPRNGRRIANNGEPIWSFISILHI